MIFKKIELPSFVPSSSLDEEQTNYGHQKQRCECNSCVKIGRMHFLKIYMYGLVFPFLWVYVIWVYLRLCLLFPENADNDGGISFPKDYTLPTDFTITQVINEYFVKFEPKVAKLLKSNYIKINERFGHALVEEALSSVSEKLKKNEPIEDHLFDTVTMTSKNCKLDKVELYQEFVYKQDVHDVIDYHYETHRVLLKWTLRSFFSLCTYFCFIAMLFLVAYY